MLLLLVLPVQNLTLQLMRFLLRLDKLRLLLMVSTLYCIDFIVFSFVNFLFAIYQFLISI